MGFVVLIIVCQLSAQEVVFPTLISQPAGFAVSGPLSNNPVVSYTDFPPEENFINGEINPNIQPPDYSNLPIDPAEQLQQGLLTSHLLDNFAGQNTNSYPPDANGDVNGSYYFQTVNKTYAIFDKSDGSIVAGPSNLNAIFDSSLPGANCNSGDPIVLWDENAERWFYAELSICNANDYILIAVSTSSDPTGTWYSWSFDADDMPDYPKFGIWHDGYYMATNTPYGDDVYVLERDAMIQGDSDPTMIAFDNPNRPSTFDGIHCILPLDNDGSWAPTGTPGQFITIADDDQGNPADALYIYELQVDWTTPSNSTFSRTQTLNVNSFSGNFNSSWNNIPQPGTSQKLCALSQILMHRAQYRNFNGTQKIVCTHTIAESATEAAIRWYELENTGSDWSIVQQGTYNPDNISRWCPSIAMNDIGEIAMGYSVSDGSSTYPGIRYCGQTNAAPLNEMDVEETIIWDGDYSQTYSNRWGDYASMSVDPDDGNTFWFTSQYKNSSTHGKGTRIAKLSLIDVVLANRHSGNPTSNLGGTLSLYNLDTPDMDFEDVESDSDPVPVITNDSYTVRTNNHTLQGERHLKWNDSNEDYLLEKANFEMTIDHVEEGLNANFDFQETVVLTNDVGVPIAIQDPWYIQNPEEDDPEQWVQTGTDWVEVVDGSYEVFLNQNPLFNDTDPIYSLRAPYMATQDGIYGVVGWETTDANVFEDPDYPGDLSYRLVVFHESSVINAIYDKVNNLNIVKLYLKMKHLLSPPEQTYPVNPLFMDMKGSG